MTRYRMHRPIASGNARLKAVARLFLVVSVVSGCFGETGTADRGPTSTTAAASRGEQAGRWLVYASRKGHEVVVFRRPVGPGPAEELFRYQDGYDDPPDVTASADGRLVAYIVGGIELHVRDLPEGRDAVLVSGEMRERPPNADAFAPRWSVDDMNYLAKAQEAECPECGIRGISGAAFSPSGNWVAFRQNYYEGANWGFVERLSGRYETSGDAGGDAFWKTDEEVVTIGAFYGEDAEVRTASMQALPSSRMVPVGAAKPRVLRGSLSPASDIAVVFYDEHSDQQAGQRRLGLLKLEAGELTAVGGDGEKLTAGFSGSAAVAWVERSGTSGVLVRPDTDPVPLPPDLYAFSAIHPAGPDQIGLHGARRPPCTEIRGPCEGPTPPFEKRYLVIDVRDGRIVWESPGFDATTSFAGLVSTSSR
jgi:hypothetical protein